MNGFKSVKSIHYCFHRYMKLLSPSVADDFFIRKHFKDLQIDAPDTVYDYGERGLARNEQSISKSPTVGLQCFNSTSSSSSSYPSSAVVRCKSDIPFYSKDQILNRLRSKWLLFIGDSSTRGMVLALISQLDRSQTQPIDVERWYNVTEVDQEASLGSLWRGHGGDMTS